MKLWNIKDVKERKNLKGNRKREERGCIATALSPLSQCVTMSKIQNYSWEVTVNESGYKVKLVSERQRENRTPLVFFTKSPVKEYTSGKQ